MYLLIAFKPEYRFHDRGDDEVLQARLVREEYADLDQVVARAVELRTARPEVEYRYGSEADCVFEEVLVFESVGEVDLGGRVAAGVRAWREKHDAVALQREDMREAAFAAQSAEVLRRLFPNGYPPVDSSPEVSNGAD